MSQSTIEKSLPVGETLAQFFTGATSPTEVQKVVPPQDFAQPTLRIISFSGAENQSQIFPLGAPQMRTLWQVQSIAVQFSALLFANAATIANFKNGEMGKWQIGANVWIAGKNYPFFLGEASLSNLVIWEEAGGILHGRMIEYLRRRLYVLELFSPIELSKAQDLAISLSLKQVESPKSGTLTLSAFIVNPLVVVTLDSEIAKQ